MALAFSLTGTAPLPACPLTTPPPPPHQARATQLARASTGGAAWSRGQPLLRPLALRPVPAALRRAAPRRDSATCVARAASSKRGGGDDGLVDTAVTVVFGGALLLSVAYMLASFATGGTAGALAARPFALPAATLLLLAKFVTNSALLLVEAACAALYQIPSGLAVPVSLALMFFRMRAARAARQEASSRFARDNPEVVAQARGRLAPGAALDGPDDDIDTMANGGTRRRGSGTRAVAAPSAPSTVIVRAERPAAAPAPDVLPTARVVTPPTASSAPSPAGARAAAVAAAAASDSAARQAQVQARNADVRAAAIAKAKAELRAKAAAVAAAAAAVSLDALPVTAAPSPPPAPVQLAGKPSSAGSTAAAAPSAPAPASSPVKAASAVGSRDVVPPPFFRSASTPAAAAAAEAAARVIAKGMAEEEDDAASGTVKVKAGAQTLQRVKPSGPRSLKDLSLLELGALAAQMVAKDALDNVAKSGTVSLSRATTKA